MADIIMAFLPIIGIIVLIIGGFTLLKEIVYRIHFDTKKWANEYKEEKEKDYWDYINEMKEKVNKDQE